LTRADCSPAPQSTRYCAADPPPGIRLKHIPGAACPSPLICPQATSADGVAPCRPTWKGFRGCSGPLADIHSHLHIGQEKFISGFNGTPGAAGLANVPPPFGPVFFWGKKKNELPPPGSRRALAFPPRRFWPAPNTPWRSRESTERPPPPSRVGLVGGFGRAGACGRSGSDRSTDHLCRTSRTISGAQLPFGAGGEGTLEAPSLLPRADAQGQAHSPRGAPLPAARLRPGDGGPQTDPGRGNGPGIPRRVLKGCWNGPGPNPCTPG